MNYSLNSIACMLTLTCACVGHATGGDATRLAPETGSQSSELQSIADEITELRARNNALAERVQAHAEDQWLDAERTAEIRGIVQDVLNDSQARTSLQSSNLLGGYTAGKGFFLSTSDGSFSLKIDGQIQYRWVLNYNDSGQQYDYVDYLGVNSDTRVGNRTAWGASVRRAKIHFEGNVVDPTWTYKVDAAFGSSSGVYSFEDVLISKAVTDELKVSVGQMKAPFLREELVSSRRQLAVDRSMTNLFFTQARAVGLEVVYKANDWKVQGFYGNGVRSAIDSSTTFTNWSDNPTKWSFAGRFEYKIAGDWSDFRGFTSTPGQETAVMVGVGAMGQEYNGQLSLGELAGLPIGPLAFNSLLGFSGTLDGSSVYGVTADVSAKFGSMSVFAAFVWQQYSIKGNSTGTYFGASFDEFAASTSNPWGFVVQAGYSLTEKFELFGRYAYVDADLGDFTLKASGLPAPFPAQVSVPLSLGESEVGIITIGGNYFVNDQIKLTCDWGINLESTIVGAGTSGLAGLGWGVTNSPYEWVLRGQVQLLF